MNMKVLKMNFVTLILEDAGNPYFQMFAINIAVKVLSQL